MCDLGLCGSPYLIQLILTSLSYHRWAKVGWETAGKVGLREPGWFWRENNTVDPQCAKRRRSHPVLYKLVIFNSYMEVGYASQAMRIA